MTTCYSKKWVHARFQNTFLLLTITEECRSTTKKFLTIAWASKEVESKVSSWTTWDWLSMWIFYPVVSLSTLNITVVFCMIQIRIYGRNGLVWLQRRFCFCRTIQDLISPSQSVNISWKSAGNYYHIPL